ncbi:MAG: GNAT family N-acetyltransferase [Patescibacteria group bacterium]
MRYLSFNPRRDEDLLPGLVECYQSVFANEPWNEWKRCPACNKQWGSAELTAEQAQANCSNCGNPLVDFWSAEKVAADIMLEVTVEASCWLAVDGDQVVGFTWGYPVTSDELIRKLKLSPAETEAVRYSFGTSTKVAYQDEIGVLYEYRRQGIGRCLFALRLNDFLRQGLGVGVVRTKEQPPSVTYHWYRRRGYRVVGRYTDGTNRVVLARELGGVAVLQLEPPPMQYLAGPYMPKPGECPNYDGMH